MTNYIEERAKEVGAYMVATRCTIRKMAKVFGISKSTVAKDLERIQKINPELSKKVREVIDFNISQRHIRGGLANKRKYSCQ